MIPSDAAGVIYTMNRSTGDRSEMQIDSIWGLGEPLTQARVYPDRFRVSKASGAVLEEQVHDKTVRLSLGMDGAAEQQAVEESQIRAPSLAASQIPELVAMARGIEDLMGEPQDIEWALSGGRFYILQARPIAQRQS
jgi:pyruvate,water dikinase